MSTKNNVLLSLIIILVVAAGGFWLLNRAQPEPQKPVTTSPDTSGWKSTTSGGVTFKYPEKLGTEYISTQDWPPSVQVITGPFVCTNAGEEIERAGKTETITVSGHTYCRTVVSEGAAGSTYNQYAYGYQKNSTTTLYFTFTLRYPQCANYDEPKKSACASEEAKFNIDLIVDKIIQSAQ